MTDSLSPVPAGRHQRRGIGEAVEGRGCCAGEDSVESEELRRATVSTPKTAQGRAWTVTEGKEQGQSGDEKT